MDFYRMSYLLLVEFRKVVFRSALFPQLHRRYDSSSSVQSSLLFFWRYSNKVGAILFLEICNELSFNSSKCLAAYYSFNLFFSIYCCWWHWTITLLGRSGSCYIKAGRLPENSSSSFVDLQSKKTVKKTDKKVIFWLGICIKYCCLY